MKWLFLTLIFGVSIGGLFLVTADLPAKYVEGKYANTASKFVMLDGLRVHYRDEGIGPVLVLLHGSNASLHTWQGWVEELKGDFRVLTLDLPGHGLTGPDIKTRYDWQGMSDIVDLLMTELHIEKFSIGGNSMGGAIAWNYTVNYPGKINKLILVDSAGYPREENRPAVIRAFGLPLIGYVMTKISSEIAVRKSLEDVYGDKAKVTQELVTLYSELSLRTGNRHASRTRLSSPPDDQYYKNISRIKTPTLILWGQKDKWIFPKYAHRFATDITNNTLIIFKGLGHVPMEEAPKTTALEVKKFLKGDM